MPIHRNNHLLAYRRAGGDKQWLVVLNLRSEPQSFPIGEQGVHDRILLSTFLDRQDEEAYDPLELRGDEGEVVGNLIRNTDVINPSSADKLSDITGSYLGSCLKLPRSNCHER